MHSRSSMGWQTFHHQQVGVNSSIHAYFWQWNEANYFQQQLNEAYQIQRIYKNGRQWSVRDIQCKQKHPSLLHAVLLKQYQKNSNKKDNYSKSQQENKESKINIVRQDRAT